MTISGNSAMSSYVSQVYSNKNVQSQSGASGTWTDNSAQSFDAIAQQLMSALDTNNSGTIDKTEFSQAAQALSNNTADTTKVDTAFSKADQNGDGQISSDEFLNALKQASAQTHKQHHHKPAADTAATQTSPSATPSDSALSLSQMQKNLLSKILAAYGNSTTTTGSTTNLSA
ncbi:EF-hand domain-containing protein [Sulfuricurvum sp.]|uniref:EF-hand domain-containing protein n=1 Tax=Sulfuricurvum sp. TaxID=2025608 RepID=UPI0035677BE6